jgi:L-threonylcarbamoyladenylate synthase
MRIVGPDTGGIHAAAAALRADDLVVLPTDTVYGLAVRADRPGAAEALATAKGRPKRQAIAVLVAGMDQARSLALVDERFECLADAFWPGPLTLVALRRPGTALELGEPATTIGVRCPDDEIVIRLVAEVGPLAVTSANRHGEPTFSTGTAAAAVVEGAALAVEDGARSGVPSTVVDISGPGLDVIREGAITIGTIERSIEAH